MGRLVGSRGRLHLILLPLGCPCGLNTCHSIFWSWQSGSLASAHWHSCPSSTSTFRKNLERLVQSISC